MFRGHGDLSTLHPLLPPTLEADLSRTGCIHPPLRSHFMLVAGLHTGCQHHPHVSLRPVPRFDPGGERCDHMATNPKRTNRQQIQQCNRAVSRRVHMPIAYYKSIKAATQFAAVAAGIFAIAEGADPDLILTLIAAVIVGPEAMETVIASGDEGT